MIVSSNVTKENNVFMVIIGAINGASPPIFLARGNTSILPNIDKIVGSIDVAILRTRTFSPAHSSTMGRAALPGNRATSGQK
jgi:hypothetical protein